MVFWGLHGMTLPRFALVDSIGCVIGGLVFTGLGYLVSGSATVLLGKFAGSSLAPGRAARRRGDRVHH